MVIVRTCSDCQEPFEIGDEEQTLFRDIERKNGQAMYLPRRCVACRAARRAEKYWNPVTPGGRDEEIVCCDCSQRFVFGGRDREYFAAHGYTMPRRCRPCRQARKLTRIV